MFPTFWPHTPRAPSFVGWSSSSSSRTQAPPAAAPKAWRQPLTTRRAAKGKAAPGKQELLEQLKEGRDVSASAQKLRKGGHLSDPQDFNILISALGQQKLWRQALGAFQEMRDAEEGTLRPSVVSYSAAISAVGAAKKWQWALHLLQDLEASHLQPDATAHNAAISAAEKGKKWKVAVQILQHMEEQQLELQTVSYSTAILACARNKKWQLGLVLLDEMPEKTLEPDSQTYDMLLSECEQHGSKGHESALADGLSDNKPSGVIKSTGSSKTSSEGLKAAASSPPRQGGRQADGTFQPVPCTSAMNAQRVKGKPVQSKASGIQPMVDSAPAVPAVPTRGPLRTRRSPPVKAGQPYAKELRVLQFVVDTAIPGDPRSVCEAIENFGDEVLVKGKARLWLKIAGGVKTDVLSAAVKGGPIGDGDLQCSVLEVGAYCGYSSTRMALALPGVHIASLEVDPVHVVVARNVILHGGLQGTIDVWTGHSKDLLARILTRYGGPGHLQFGAVFMDQKGSRYEEDMLKMESEGLLNPGAVVVADNVLKPGAPLFLYKIMNGGRYHAQIVSMDEFAMPSEDWMSINVKKRKEPKKPEPEAPEDLHQLSKEADRMRERATGPGRSVTYEEWAEFAQEVKKRLKKNNVELTADLRPENSRDRDMSFSH